MIKCGVLVSVSRPPNAQTRCSIACRPVPVWMGPGQPWPSSAMTRVGCWPVPKVTAIDRAWPWSKALVMASRMMRTNSPARRVSVGKVPVTATATPKLRYVVTRASSRSCGLAAASHRKEVVYLIAQALRRLLGLEGYETVEDFFHFFIALFHDGIHGKVDQHRLALFPADEDSFIKAVYGRLDGAGRQTLLILVVSPWKEADQAPGQTNQGQNQRTWQPVIEDGQQQDRRRQNQETPCLTVAVRQPASESHIPCRTCPD